MNPHIASWRGALYVGPLSLASDKYCFLGVCRYENEFWDDMSALGCGYPDVLVRVTE